MILQRKKVVWKGKQQCKIWLRTLISSITLDSDDRVVDSKRYVTISKYEILLLEPASHFLCRMTTPLTLPPRIYTCPLFLCAQQMSDVSVHACMFSCVCVCVCTHAHVCCVGSGCGCDALVCRRQEALVAPSWACSSLTMEECCRGHRENAFLMDTPNSLRSHANHTGIHIQQREDLQTHMLLTNIYSTV